MHRDALNQLDSLLRVFAIKAHEFEQADLWNRVAVAAARDDQRGNDCERQRNLHTHRCSGAGFRLHIDSATDFAASSWLPRFDFDTAIDYSALEQLHDLRPMIEEQIRLAMPQAQREMAKAQLEVAKSLRQIQPKLNIELKNAQKQIEREMKNLEKQLKYLDEDQP